jgi:flagellar protein FlaG
MIINPAAMNTAEQFNTQKGLAADQVETARSKKDDKAAEEGSKPDKDKEVQPEELLDTIKALSEDGAYSVRFEMNEEISDMVVQIWDNEKQEMLRQFPAEEIINFRSAFQKATGNIVDTRW